MAYHVFRNVDRHMGLTIMNSNSHGDHLRKDHGSTRPGFDHTAVATALHAQDFLSERLMNVRPFFSGARHLLLPPTSIATPNDELIRSLIITSFVTQSRFAPGGLWLPTNWRTALTTAMRMVAWVHHRSTYGRTAAQMARTSGLTKTAILVIDITHLPDRCHAENMHTTLLTRW